MNKDVIYIEPEDDITDIIAKIENSKEKIVALVPPKRAGVFRSIVNIKLIAKAGATADKKVVLVTVDPSITKLAGATKLPVAKNLQSAPVIPLVENEEPEESEKFSELEEEEEETEPSEEEEKTSSNKDNDFDNKKTKNSKTDSKHKEKSDEDDDEEEEEEEEKPKKTAEAKKKKSNTKLSGRKILDWIKLHKWLSVLIGVFGLGLIIFLIWALKIAPAVDVAIAIKTEQKNFSESINFTDVLTDENAKEGKFYLEEKKIENAQEVNFEATGQKNNGEKASGEVMVRYSFTNAGSVPINQGTVFSINGLNYIAAESTSLEWSGWGNSAKQMKENAKSCNNDAIEDEYCTKSKVVKVVAERGGTAYNIPASDRGWLSAAQVTVWSENPMTGGTDDIKTVVQQSDVEKAKAELVATKEEESKIKLYDSIDDKYYIIEPSFGQSASTVTATPAVDEEVKEGVKPTLKATTTASVYVIDKIKLEEFINEKAELEDNQKIYEIKDIYIKNLSRIQSGATSKLKAQYFIGPKLTESEAVEKIKGKGLGDAQRELRDIFGVSDVKIDPSYPWVMSVPGDTNKITVHFEVKDQDGNEIKNGNEQEEQSDESQNTNKNQNEQENNSEE